MSKFLPAFGQVLRYLRTLLVLCSLLLLALSLPAQAAARINPQLEEQILQVIRQHPEVISETFSGAIQLSDLEDILARAK